mmetsp:Transcript_15324/g.35874  ORF Transcript_15324/g.35874 Transcript_15324/m.35874 type:complete len:88 (+) Transcript_15324:127-390(+)
MRPSSSTTTRVARATVPRRWAATITVLPSLASCASVSATAPSDSPSKADVGSSSSNTLESLASARAKAKRWRWPPESRAPRSPSCSS